MMVAMNYRLQIFGFLALNELSLKDPRGVSGNYGIADQQLALKWVQQNIGAFGGNSKQVSMKSRPDLQRHSHPGPLRSWSFTPELWPPKNQKAIRFKKVGEAIREASA